MPSMPKLIYQWQLVGYLCDNALPVFKRIIGHVFSSNEAVEGIK